MFNYFFDLATGFSDQTNSLTLFTAGICSLFGNGMLLYISYRKKHLLKPAEYLIVNLAVSDLGLTLSLYPMAITSSFYHRYCTWHLLYKSKHRKMEYFHVKQKCYREDCLQGWF